VEWGDTAMRIEGFTTHDGTDVRIRAFTVLVGPNNVGKSQTLRDIHAKMTRGQKARSVVVEALHLSKPPNLDALLHDLDIHPDPTHIGMHRLQGIGASLTRGDQVRINLADLDAQLGNADSFDAVLQTIGRFKVSFLDAESRLAVVKEAPAHNPHKTAPENLLQGLFDSRDASEQLLRDAFQNAFGMDLRLDYSGMTELAIRVARQFGEIPEDPRRAFPVFEEYQKLDEQGDGFRSFVGVVLSLLLSHGRVILLDEPEAFLHPAQARQLGTWIASHAASTPGQIIVATHNASFLSGILSSGSDVDVLRMNRTGDSTSYSLIPADVTAKLARDPLLSSQRVMEAIFYPGVVVCEGDADRAFYHALACRCQEQPGLLFVHSHSKQSVPLVTEPLRAASIPVAAIVDLDAISSDADLGQLVCSLSSRETADRATSLRQDIVAALDLPHDAAVLTDLKRDVREFLVQLEQGDHTRSGARSALNRLRTKASDWHEVKAGGVGSMPPKARELTKSLVEMCAEVGLFLVPVGELERWLDLGTTRKKDWIVRALHALVEGRSTPELDRFADDVLKWFK